MKTRAPEALRLSPSVAKMSWCFRSLYMNSASLDPAEPAYVWRVPISAVRSVIVTRGRRTLA